MDKYALVFLTKGFEEIEALATVDILRRGGVNVNTVSLDEDGLVEGAHKVMVLADSMFEKIWGEYDMLILPGGPGYSNYFQHEGLKKLILEHHAAGRLIAAICAAPTYLASLGLLEGKTAVCFPGMEDGMKGAIPGSKTVEQDGNIITSKCPVTALAFGLYLVEALMGKECARQLYDEMHYEFL